MREIKFRFWDSIEGIWCDRNWLESNANEVLFGWLTLDNIPKEIHVMQYTGLKDKHGTAVYEGDIVKAQYYNYEKRTPGYIIGLIAYDTEQFIGYRIGDTRMSACSNFEVIGNQYENPDLLQS